MTTSIQHETHEAETARSLATMFEVEGYGMVRMHGAFDQARQLWLPFEPMPVQMRLM